MSDSPGDPTALFQVFNEIGIIEQLSRTLLEARLPKGLIAPHFSVLNHLIRVADGRTPVELARAFQVPKTSMTHTVSGLQKHGLVQVRPNPNDGRSKCVWITEAGRTLRDRTIADLEPDFQQLVAGMDLERVLGILPVLTDMRVFLDAHRNAEGPRDREFRNAR
ncbi:MarR family transcriptional regulator [Aestuariivita sp.]|uniref:MarR family winged helix-turn-helix transcriptional regulator n=1 Tax=Aestuariivita sp. TaxID=1872407 RepID=UPI0025C19691|nr:MarR family transcriptional regulator [Aestuariivita sp.]